MCKLCNAAAESVKSKNSRLLVSFDFFFPSRYTGTGEFVEELPDLIEARLGLACSSFADQNGDIVSWIFYI